MIKIKKLIPYAIVLIMVVGFSYLVKDILVEKMSNKRKKLVSPEETNMLLGNQSEMFMFSSNKYSPECCKHTTISGSNGCPCLTSEQTNLLKMRGGNRALSKWDETFNTL